MPSENKTPAIRFAGFTGEWEQDKFGNLIQSLPYKPFIRSSEIDGTYAIIQQGNEPIVGYADGTPCEDYRDVIIFGDHTLSLYKPRAPFFVSTDGVRIIKSKTNQDAFFMLYLLEKNMPKSEGYKRHFAILCNQMCSSSSNLKEQQRLGLFFRDLDTLITLHRRKCELLETLKKSMLEKLFPKEGELVPELRFVGFTGEWEWRNFGNIASRMCELSTERSLPRVEYEDIISERGVLNKDIKLKNCHKAGIRFDHQNVLYGKLRPYLHNWLLPDFTGIAVGDFWVLLPQGIDRSFLFALIQSSRFDNVANQSTGTKMPRADWKLVSKSKFLVPIASGEQHQIGRFIYLIEECITLHRRKLELLQNIKKACLEKMFV